jgi:serine/threonine protein kinase
MSKNSSSKTSEFNLSELQKHLSQLSPSELGEINKKHLQSVQKFYRQLSKQLKKIQEEQAKKQVYPRQLSFQFQGKQHKFTIIKKLGSGATSTVYLIRDENNDNFVLKQGVENKKHLIQAQNTILQKLKQKNLCNYFVCPLMYIPRQNSADIVMSYLNNYMELGTALAQKYSITNKNKAIIKQKLEEGLNKLHEHKFIHSDIKPGNIMVKVDARKKKILNDAKIIDMGGVLEFGRKSSKKCIKMMTPAYTDFRILFPQEKVLTQQQLKLKYRKNLHEYCFDFETLKQVDNKALEKTLDKIKPKQTFFGLFTKKIN